MQAPDHLVEQALDANCRSKKRYYSSCKESEQPSKIRRVHKPQGDSIHSLEEEAEARTEHTDSLEQLPSPALTKSKGDHSCAKLPVSSHKAKRKSGFEQSYPVSKRLRGRSRNRSPSDKTSSVNQWLSKLPPPKGIKSMSRLPSKRSRSSDSLGQKSTQSGDGSESTVSRDNKSSAYKDVNYTVVLETKNSFMRVSKAGETENDRKLCQQLLRTKQTLPKGSMFDDKHFEEFCSLLQDRSEARIYLDLHPILVPSAEILCLSGQRSLENLVQGYNDPWVKAIPIYGPRPQPDHTVGFRWSTFTDEQRRKLGIDPAAKSYYTAREDIYFPFLTSEIKCGKQGLDLANRQNAHSMTIAVRAVVELFRSVGRAMEVHRRILGFSISHDDKTVRIYGHYPEIDGDSTAYYRRTIKDFSFGGDEGRERWATYTFTCNVYDIFVPTHLDRIKSALDQLPDPLAESLDETTSLVERYALSSQGVSASEPESPGPSGFRKPGAKRDVNAGLRTLIQTLQKQLEQQRKESEQQRKESEQQRKESEQQRKESEQQRTELMKLLNQQSEQLKQLLARS